MSAKLITGQVFKNGTCVNLARVTGEDAANVTQASIASATYTVYGLNEASPNTRTVVANHEAVAVVVADVIFDALQLDDLWGDLDASGYNFRHVVPITVHQAFSEAGVTYLIEYTLTPVSGQPIKAPFRVRCR